MNDKHHIEYLFGLLDDIDTVSDIARDDDKLYRRCVEAIQKKRTATGITCDGYNITIPND